MEELGVPTWEEEEEEEERERETQNFLQEKERTKKPISNRWLNQLSDRSNIQQVCGGSKILLFFPSPLFPTFLHGGKGIRVGASCGYTVCEES